MENLTSFEEAATSLGIDPKVLPVVTALPEDYGKAIVATFKLFIISEASWKVENKVIDWNNYDQRKYYPWWDMETYGDQVGSASGFSYFGFLCDRSDSFVGSRLVFPSREAAKYVADQHYQLYRDMMVKE